MSHAALIYPHQLFEPHPALRGAAGRGVAVTLIVVTADHGVAFRAGRTFRGVAPETWPNVAWIPLIVKAKTSKPFCVVPNQCVADGGVRNAAVSSSLYCHREKSGVR